MRSVSERASRKRTSPNSPTAKVSVEVGPVSGLANASKGRRNVFPHPFGAVTLKIRLRFAYRCGGSPGIKRPIARLHRIPVSLASLRGLVRAPDNDLRLSQTEENDNTARDAARSWRRFAEARHVARHRAALGRRATRESRVASQEDFPANFVKSSDSLLCRTYYSYRA